MALTTAQQQALKSAILADATMAAYPNNSDGNFDLCRDKLNVTAVPDYIVWRSDVPLEEVMRNGMDWTRVDNLSVGKARIWDWLSRLGTLNAAQVNVRAGIDATWVGTAADLAVRASVYSHCKRAATVVEKILATGSGTDASPSTMGFEGQISYADVQQARSS